MKRGDEIIVKEPSSFFIGRRGIIAGFNPLFHWSLRIKFYDTPYNVAQGYWFSRNEIVLAK